MTSRLKWAKVMLREVFQDGRNYYWRWDNRGFKGSSHATRILKNNHAKSTSLSYSARRFAPADCTYNHLQNGRALKEAVASLISSGYQGTAVDPHDYVNVLQLCSKQKDYESVKQVHDCVKKSGLEQHPYVCNSLLKCYIGCGRLLTANDLFRRLLNKDIVSWSIMIGGYAEHDKAEDALEFYKKLREEGWQPNEVTYLAVLKACTSPLALKRGKDIHAHIIQDGYDEDVRVCNALVHMYAKCGCLDDARMVFDKMVVRTVVSWNAIIGGFALHGHGHEAFLLFQKMQAEGFTPNSTTYLCILSARGDPKDLAWVKEVHNHARNHGLAQDLCVNTALIRMYAKCGSMDDATLVFDSMMNRDVVSWTAMIGGLAQDGRGLQAFALLHQMQREGVLPNAATYVSILNPNACEGALTWVKEVHGQAARSGLIVDLRVASALVQMYAKTGSITDARQVFEKMLKRDVVSWSVMIGGLAQHGHGREALQLFDEMKLKGVTPHGPLFVAVLSACSHAGLVDEGRTQFVSMKRDYGIEPDLEHYTCMVDMLGRAGHLEQAKRFVLSMPIKPNKVTWKALLGACRVYYNLELAELAAKECINLEPTDSSSYVLLSNLYAAVGSWDQVFLIRRIMQESGIRKDPGRCWIEVNNKVHYFVAGDTSHPEAKEIQTMLNSLSQKMKADGYIPDTRLVLRNIDEEDRESALGSHSEKLALAYGLMHVTQGNPIRIYKNLRICKDCHAATKVISKITGREIVARDASRFHHFKDGLCSCGDYW